MKALLMNIAVLADVAISPVDTVAYLAQEYLFSVLVLVGGVALLLAGVIAIIVMLLKGKKK
ncbi:MAG: hypothetical protein E7334_10045 [Clostridiales bacterium]|nr:hypothetical protein [Clostridiales bacterium]